MIVDTGVNLIVDIDSLQCYNVVMCYKERLWIVILIGILIGF